MLKWHIMRNIPAHIPGRVDKTKYFSSDERFIVTAFGYPNGWGGFSQEWILVRNDAGAGYPIISLHNSARKAKAAAELIEG